MFPTRNPSARAAAHRAMARAALFADSSASTRLKRYNHHTEKACRLEAQASLPTFTIYLARTGERLEVRAETWQQAVKRTGRADACLVEIFEPGKYDLAFDPDSPFIVTDVDLSRGLATVVAFLDGAERSREVES
ncbi:hypothetical protein [Billgrantia antri]|uniref:Uncharacterized protein n=1 Tax=Billgrantia antri TaxID=2846777 RepID=A0ABS6ZMR4_9GAMM|nr:hypothetical protein [Halomonas antri]MBW6390214.1 hypothetical protein [Halomonas antri]